MENFVLRVAAEFSSRKEQLVFLINNYDMMLGVLMVTLLPRESPQLVSSTGAQQCAVCSEGEVLATVKGSQAPDWSCLP